MADNVTAFFNYWEDVLNKHILLLDQIMHLKTNKGVTSTNEEIACFISEKPYEMTIQQVKLFFKNSNGAYDQKPIEEWIEQYNRLQSDSLRMFKKIIDIENRLKNELFIATQDNQEWISNYYKFVDMEVNKPYYKRVNNTSMGNIICAYKEYYEITGINLLTFEKLSEYLSLTFREKLDFERIRSRNASSYIEDTLLQKLRGGVIALLEIELIENQLKKELKDWVKKAVESYDNFYLYDVMPVVFKTVVSKSFCQNKIINPKMKEDSIAKQNDDMMIELIECYKIQGFDYRKTKKRLVNSISNNIYDLIKEKLKLEMIKIYSDPDSAESIKWNEFFEANDYFRANELELEDSVEWLKKTHVTVEMRRGSDFNSTNKLLIAYKVFRDQVAHGRTIVEPLKTPNDILFKEIVMKNLITHEYSIKLDEYLSLCDYWKEIA